ncbi:MAG: hypothetical protein P1V35_02645 [Planctomycetota bacterium]|nr:hypothetical protein [Planctomycetota bacterium]
MQDDRQKMTKDPVTQFLSRTICWCNRSICVLAVALLPGVLLFPGTLSFAYQVWQYAAFVLIMYLLVFRKNEAIYKSGERTPPWL